MSDTSDWRLTNQEKYLRGVALFWQPYAPASPDNDHDHCAFCFAKFMLGSHPETLQDGYATIDRYHWVCKSCFNDFATQFEWVVGSEA